MLQPARQGPSMIPRYSRPEMASLWSAPARLRRWRDVELAALEGMVQAKMVPASALAIALMSAPLAAMAAAAVFYGAYVFGWIAR